MKQSEKLLHHCNLYTHRWAQQVYIVIWSVLSQFKWPLLFCITPGGVAALVSVSEAKIQITLLILRRGALYTINFCHLAS